LGALAVLWRQWRKPSADTLQADAPPSKPVNKAPPLPAYARTPTVPSQLGAEATVGPHTSQYQER
jgi:hypothetical protein